EGVVHRDLKPRNVLVNPRGRGPDFVRILDFGVAKVLGGGQLAPTTVGRVMGSVLYLAPEQVMSGGAPPTPAVDQFSLASIFFECLTLRRAWARDDDGVPLSFDVPVGAEGDNKQMTILKRIVRQESPRLRAWRSDAGAEAERVLARALSKEPADRFSSVEVFGQALAGALTRASGDADDPEDTAWERLPPLDDYGST
ncbi:MAG: protein kinase, partial [Myxococcota bacterium]